MALAGMTQEQTEKRLRERCEQIAESLEAYADGTARKCHHCGAVRPIDQYEETEHDDAGGTWCICPDCKMKTKKYDLEPVDMYDYLRDALDVSFFVSSKKEYQGVELLVSCGGPNIYVSTISRNVELYWGGDRAFFPLRSDVLDALDDWAADWWSDL